MLLTEKTGVFPGKKFGRWTVIEFAYSAATGEGQVLPHLRVACECGTSKILSVKVLKSGEVESCGCS